MTSSLAMVVHASKRFGQPPAQMSNVNIKRAVENIPAKTNVYTPLVETIVNAIQAIDETGRRDGKISIRIKRSGQMELDRAALPEITGFEIEDNGIGFTDKHRDSFDTLYSEMKEQSGGKGYGRLTTLKYFNEVQVSSVYKQEGQFKQRSFSVGRKTEIIVDEVVSDSQKADTGSTLYLSNLKNKSSFEKKADTLARNLVERLLPYFVTEGYTCPEIILEDGPNGPIRLNDFVSGDYPDAIQEIPLEPSRFCLPAEEGQQEEFKVRLFKLYAPRHQSNQVSLVAHQREVSTSSLADFTPEFAEGFFEKKGQGGKNYVIKAYVSGGYLDRHVSLERGDFNFGKDPKLAFPIGQRQIEEQAAMLSSRALGDELHTRKEKKKAQVQDYVDKQSPWHKDLVEAIDLNTLPYNPTEEQIEQCLHKEKFTQERATRRELNEVMQAENFSQVESKTKAIVEKLSLAQKNELAHYVALRRGILDLLEKGLQRDGDGRYTSEGIVHDIIFPRKGDSQQTPFREHNLWLLDERLNFTEYVSSDLPLSKENEDRPDILAYNQRIMFRGNNVASNPITVFELKKPGRDDFANPSSKDDPVAQIVRYVNSLRDGKFETPTGREINIEENTPAYGYIVCDINKKVGDWLFREKGFKPTPDGIGWFRSEDNINLYMEVISWDKLLNDATMRNKIFFHKLGI